MLSRRRIRSGARRVPEQRPHALPARLEPLEDNPVPVQQDAPYSETLALQTDTTDYLKAYGIGYVLLDPGTVWAMVKNPQAMVAVCTTTTQTITPATSLSTSSASSSTMSSTTSSRSSGTTRGATARSPAPPEAEADARDDPSTRRPTAPSFIKLKRRHDPIHRRPPMIRTSPRSRWSST